MAVQTKGLLMGGEKKTQDQVLGEQLASKYGSHVTKAWGLEHGLFTQEDIDAQFGGQAEGSFEDFIGGLGEKVEATEAQEMGQLDEEWAIKKRKTMKEGKKSLLSGGTTGLGLEATTSNSLLKG